MVSTFFSSPLYPFADYKKNDSGDSRDGWGVDDWQCRLEELPLHTFHQVEDDQTGAAAPLCKTHSHMIIDIRGQSIWAKKQPLKEVKQLLEES